MSILGPVITNVLSFFLVLAILSLFIFLFIYLPLKIRYVIIKNAVKNGILEAHKELKNDNNDIE